MSQEDKRTVKKIQAGLALLLLAVVIVGAIVVSDHSGSTMKAVAMDSSPKTSTARTTTTTSSTANYKNGTYQATGMYDSPGGEESLKVSLTLVDDKVTDSTVVSMANDPTATSYQKQFISGYKSYVIGKDITAIRVSNVSGSSLTSQGFNDALKQIEKQSQA